MWIPGHIRIPSNEQVDQAANQTTHVHTIKSDFIPTIFDLTQFIRQFVTQQACLMENKI